MINTVAHLVTVEEVTDMALKVHHLRPAPGAKTAKTRVGRGEGGKGGKTAGRGTKGTGARKGTPENFEGGQMPLHMRIPKLRGFKNPFRVEYQVVNLDKLGNLFPEGGSVGVDDLVAAGAVRVGAAGQGPRQRRDRGGGAGQRPRLLDQRQGQDRRCRWEHHRALTGQAGRRHCTARRAARTPAGGPLAFPEEVGAVTSHARQVRRKPTAVTPGADGHRFLRNVFQAILSPGSFPAPGR